MIKAKIGDSYRYLHFSMNALFEINREYGNMQTALEAMESGTEEAFGTTCHIAAILAREGELARRHNGHKPLELLDENTITRHITPFDFAEIRKAIAESIGEGYTQSFKDEDEETDLGLAELRKKEIAGN